MKYLTPILSGFTTVMCLMLAWLLAYNEQLIAKIKDQPRKIAIVILLVYAVLRLVRLIQQLKKAKRS